VKRLCARLPSAWWDLGDDGNRHALMICRVCPFERACEAGDPEPHGIIRAGRAYADNGRVLPICVCGYPHAVTRVYPGTRCPRCRMPRLDQFAADIKRWAARGDTFSAMGRRIGADRHNVRDALKRWNRESSRTEPDRKAA
jgi:hypothetical protein